MSIAVITGSAGLVGSAAAEHFAALGLDVIGIDNDLRRYFFGDEASTVWNRRRVEETLGRRYRHYDIDIRDTAEIESLFSKLGNAVLLVVHAAAQPSHDWAAQDPTLDFAVNAQGTLNMLEATRRHAPGAVFIFTSTNKVYGDAPNRLPLFEQETRWEIACDHPYFNGIDEGFPIDQSLHSLFGASKLAADIFVQEYGRYFGMQTVSFRGGCLTGPRHSGTKLHGFLAYLMRCAATGAPYTIYGYKGKQVRDNIHTDDLMAAFELFFRSPRCGEVYNIGGGRFSNCSMLEAIALCEKITGTPMVTVYNEGNRRGDHIWYISDTSKFARHYPQWQQRFDVEAILRQIYEENIERWNTIAWRSREQACLA